MAILARSRNLARSFWWPNQHVPLVYISANLPQSGLSANNSRARKSCSIWKDKWNLRILHWSLIEIDELSIGSASTMSMHTWAYVSTQPANETSFSHKTVDEMGWAVMRCKKHIRQPLNKCKDILEGCHSLRFAPHLSKPSKQQNSKEALEKNRKKMQKFQYLCCIFRHLRPTYPRSVSILAANVIFGGFRILNLPRIYDGRFSGRLRSNEGIADTMQRGVLQYS